MDEMTAEHDWEELYVNRDNALLYAGMDRCRKCRRLRNTVAQPFWYFRLKRDPTVQSKEPPCDPAT